MQTVLDFLAHLGIASLSPFWIPTLLWTVIALPVHALVEARRSRSPLVKYRVYQALLYALPLAILLNVLADVSFFSSYVPEAVYLAVLPSPTPALAVSNGGPEPVFLFYAAVGLLTIAALTGAAIRTVQLAGHAAALVRMTHRIQPRLPHEVLDKRYADVLWRMLPGRDVRVGITEDAVTPMTTGIFNPAIILPASLLNDDTGLRMALAHEAVHVRRYDTLLHGIEEIVGAAFAVWPFVAAVRRQVAAHREMSCDVEVLGQSSISKKAYAQLIGRFALAPMSRADLSLGMASPPKDLEKRLSAMKNETFRAVSRSQRIQAGFGGSATMLLTILFIASCTSLGGSNKTSNQPTVSQPANPPTSPAEPSNDALYTVVDAMPQFPGGLDAMFAFMQNTMKYPEQAHKEGIEGKVFVKFVVEQDGSLDNDNIEVLHDIGGGCGAEAVRVLQAMPNWIPGKQDGVPVRVKFSMPFTFKL